MTATSSAPTNDATKPGPAAGGLRRVREGGAISAQRLVKEYTVPGHHGRGLRRLFLGRLGEIAHAHTFRAVNDVSFEIPAGQCTALVGRNGSGKSTLLRLLAGVTAPDGGAIEVPARVASLIELGAGFHPDLTGWENIFLQGRLLGLRDGEIRAALPELAGFSGLGRFLDAPLKTYSSGMQARLGFSVATHFDADAIFVDEVLSVGDAEFQARCFSRIREFRDRGKTIVLVTHHLPTAEELCTRALWLEEGRLVADGPIRQILDGYRDRLRRLAGEEESAMARRPAAGDSITTEPSPIVDLECRAVGGGPPTSHHPALISFHAHAPGLTPDAAWRLRIRRDDGVLISTLEGRLGDAASASPAGVRVTLRFDSLPLLCPRVVLEAEIVAGHNVLARQAESAFVDLVPEVAEVKNQVAEIPATWSLRAQGGSPSQSPRS